MDALVILLLLVLIIAVPVVAISGTVDALGYPPEVWKAAGHRRSRWTWQALGAFCGPVMVVYSGTYFFRVRPRLLHAQRDFATRLVFAGPAADDLPASGIRIRPPLSVNLINAAAVLVPMIVSLVSGPAAGDRFLVVGMFAVLMVLAIVTGASWGITLTPTEAVVHGPRRQHLAWTRIAAVTQQSWLGTRRVLVWTDDGRRIGLRAPAMPFPGVGAPRFEREYHMIGNWWLAHRG